MADVRALLRDERLARRITHPHATYSSAGTLSCNVCNLRLQAESLWKPHLAGKVHRKNLERINAIKSTSQVQLKSSTDETTSIQPDQEAETVIPATGVPTNGGGMGRKRKAEEESEDDAPKVTGKKRKAVDSESDEDGSQESLSRKKAKPVSRIRPAGDVTDGEADGKKQSGKGNTAKTTTAAVHLDHKPNADIDENEYAAFEAAIAAAPVDDDDTAQSAARNLLHASGDFAAAPVTAAETEVKDVEDASTQRKSKKDEELEEEKEDAARALEDEFDEMDQLEARVRRLRERREALRASESDALAGDGAGADEAEDEVQPAMNHESDDDDDDDDYDNDWGLR